MRYSDWKDKDWNTLIYAIHHQNCILLMGPDAAVEKADGTSRLSSEILANELAAELEPLIESWHIDISNLLQVSQYYGMKTGRFNLEVNVEAFYKKRLTQGLTSDLHRDLAKLPFYLTIISSPDNMFCQALEERNKEPIVESYDFKGRTKDIVQMGTIENPLVFYLYGSIKELQSLVLSENDLLDFVVAVVSKNPPLPNNILSELQDKRKNLLFLGFGFRNWYLRILLHVLQVHHKDSRSFALEQFTPNVDEFQRTVIFFRETDYKIQICNKQIDGFVRDLRERYEEKYGESLPEPSSRLQPQDTPTIFICHAGEDKDYAAYIYDKLKGAGFRPWLDKEKIRGGELWNDLIEKTIKKEIDYFVVLQSKSLTKKTVGYVNKEINFAYDRMMEFRRGTKFIIPVKIEDCPLLDDLAHLQTIDMSNKDNIEELIKTIKRDQQLRKR